MKRLSGSILNLLRVPCVMVLAIGMAACGPRPPPQEINDPAERMNRMTHDLNKALDMAAVRPGSTAYGTIAPGPVRRGISNVADVLRLPGIVANDLLQANFEDATTNTLRLGVNLTLGIGGLFDFASAVGMPKKTNDFGQTLAVWGVGEGPYVELPLFGPSTLRDTVGLAVDLAFDPVYRAVRPAHQKWVIGAQVLSRMNDRYRYSDVIDAILYESEDSYAQERLLYLQNRRFTLGQTGESGSDSDFIDPYEEIDGE